MNNQFPPEEEEGLAMDGSLSPSLCLQKLLLKADKTKREEDGG